MSYSTSPFAASPLHVTSSDAPYGLQLGMEFRAFNDQVRPLPLPQHMSISAKVTIHTQEEAKGVIAELRAVADAIEAYAPKLTESV